MNKIVLSLLVALTVALGVGSLGAATCRWKGDSAGNGLWATPENWEGGAAPVTGDEIVIPASDAERTMTNNLDAAVEIVSVRIEGVNRGKVNFAGTTPLTLTGETCWNSTNELDVSFPLVLKPSGKTAKLWASVANSKRADFDAVTLVGDEKVFQPSIAVNKDSKSTGGSIHFNGPVTTSKSSDITMECDSANVCTFFHDAVTTRGFYDTGYEQGSVYLYSQANDYDYISLAWAERVYACAANVFCPSAPLCFNKTGGTSPGNAWYDLCGCDQVANRIVSYQPGAADKVPPGYITSSTAATLTLRGTESASTVAAIKGAVTIVWDPVADNLTQTFTQASTSTATPSPTTGQLIVRRGTMALTGQVVFSNVATVRVESNATFSVDTTSASLPSLHLIALGTNATFALGASPASPFEGNALQAVLRKGAAFSFTGTQTLRLARLAYDGKTVTDGSYTKDGANDTQKADWISGDGTVTVDSSMLTGYVWRTAVSGNWEDASNWAGGVVPTSATTDEVLVDAVGGDYTVSVADGSTLPAKLKILNEAGGTATLAIAGAHAAVAAPVWKVLAGGRITVGEAGSLTLDFLSGTENVNMLQIGHGGRVEVSGGALVATNMLAGAVRVGGDSDGTSRLKVTGGLLRVATLSWGGALRLGTNSLVEVAGGVFHLPWSNNINPIAFQGGDIDVSGEGTVDLTGGSYNGSAKETQLVVTRGTMLFSGNSKLKDALSMDNSYPRIIPDKGYEARLRFAEHSRQDGCANEFIVGHSTGGRAYLEFATDQTHGYPRDVDGVCYNMNARGIVVGGTFGYGEMSVEAGYVGIAWAGLVIGGPVDVAKKSNLIFGRSEGVLNVSGGELMVHGYLDSGWRFSTPSGLDVGYGGAIPDGVTPSGRPYVGRVAVTGGKMTVRVGNCIIGTGYGSGTFVQNGGETIFAKNSNQSWQHKLVVGFVGGEGLLAISNGTFTAYEDTYVGGVGTNVLGKQVGVLADHANLPVGRHDAIGTVSFAGGAFFVTNTSQTAQLVLGADGSGAVERIGSKGTFRVSNLVFSNTVENAASGGTLTFRVDGTGCGGIVVDKALVIRDNAKLEVDVGDYELDRKTRLLTAKTVEGAFSSVSLVGAAKDHYRLAWKGTSLDLRPQRGVAVIIR